MKIFSEILWRGLASSCLYPEKNFFQSEGRGKLTSFGCIKTKPHAQEMLKICARLYEKQTTTCDIDPYVNRKLRK